MNLRLGFVLVWFTAVTATTSFSQTWKPRHSFLYPDAPSGLPGNLASQPPLEKHIVLAWNDLGMHCYQADFSAFLILPPYNVY